MIPSQTAINVRMIPINVLVFMLETNNVLQVTIMKVVMWIVLNTPHVIEPLELTLITESVINFNSPHGFHKYKL